MPLRRIADTRAHPFSNRGFGGMVWGEPVPFGDPLTDDLSSFGARRRSDPRRARHQAFIRYHWALGGCTSIPARSSATMRG